MVVCCLSDDKITGESVRLKYNPIFFIFIFFFIYEHNQINQWKTGNMLWIYWEIPQHFHITTKFTTTKTKQKIRQNFKIDDKIIYAEMLSHMITNSIIQKTQILVSLFILLSYFQYIIACSFACTHIVSMFQQEQRQRIQK